MQITNDSSRKLNSSPSTVTMPSKSKINLGGQMNYASISMSKPVRFRRADPTDDKYSEASNSQVHHNQQYQNGNGYTRVVEQGEENREGRSIGGFQLLTEKQQAVIQLRERLKNIHHFYKIRIQQQRNKNIERNQIFISIIQQLQRNHNDKVLGLQKSLQELESDKQQINVVDERMGSIKSTIQGILKQSQELKQDNQSKQRQIMKKQLVNKEKQTQCITLKQEVDVLKDKLEQFEKLRLKENRRMKELIEMVDSMPNSHHHHSNHHV